MASEEPAWPRVRYGACNQPPPLNLHFFVLRHASLRCDPSQERDLTPGEIVGLHAKERLNSPTCAACRPDPSPRAARPTFARHARDHRRLSHPCRLRLCSAGPRPDADSDSSTSTSSDSSSSAYAARRRGPPAHHRHTSAAWKQSRSRRRKDLVRLPLCSVADCANAIGSARVSRPYTGPGPRTGLRVPPAAGVRTRFLRGGETPLLPRRFHQRRTDPVHRTARPPPPPPPPDEQAAARPSRRRPRAQRRSRPRRRGLPQVRRCLIRKGARRPRVGGSRV